MLENLTQNTTAKINLSMETVTAAKNLLQLREKDRGLHVEAGEEFVRALLNDNPHIAHKYFSANDGKARVAWLAFETLEYIFNLKAQDYTELDHKNYRDTLILSTVSFIRDRHFHEHYDI